jgi:hypothetical protein
MTSMSHFTVYMNLSVWISETALWVQTKKMFVNHRKYRGEGKNKTEKEKKMWERKKKNDRRTVRTSPRKKRKNGIGIDEKKRMYEYDASRIILFSFPMTT